MVPKTPENQSLGLVVPTSVPEASAPSSVSTPESSNTQEEGMLLFVVPFPVFVLYNTLWSFPWKLISEFCNFLLYDTKFCASLLILN